MFPAFILSLLLCLCLFGQALAKCLGSTHMKQDHFALDGLLT